MAIINSAKRCSLTIFMECRYEKNLTTLGEGTPAELSEAWNKIYTEFCELCNMQLPELPLMINIHNTEIRITAVKTWIYVQRDCLQRFGFPLPELFNEFEKYGHQITYDGDNTALLNQLSTVEKKERQYNMQLTALKKKLENTKVATGKESPLNESRIDFIDIINELSAQQGYAINYDTTTVEQLGVMIGKRSKAVKVAKNN